MWQMLDLSLKKMANGIASLAAEQNADAGIFNLDNPEAKGLFNKYRARHPEHATIVLSVQDPDLANTIFVQKPFSMNKLLKAINSARHFRPSYDETNPANTSSVGLASISTVKSKLNELMPITPVVEFPVERDQDRTFCGDAPDIDLSHSDLRETIFYTPKESLQGRLEGALQFARQRNTAIIVAIKFEDDVESITLLPGVGLAIATIDDKRLSYLCTSPLYCMGIKIFRQNAEKTRQLEEYARVTKNGERLDSFFWKLALWTSRGRLPKDTLLNAPVYLKRWPNFTRLHITPGAFSIVALLLDKPIPLALLIKVLNIPQRYVFAFYSAATSLGLIEIVELNLKKDLMDSEIRNAHPQHKLFGRIIQKLKRAG